MENEDMVPACEHCGIEAADVNCKFPPHGPDICDTCWSLWLGGRTLDAALAYEQDEHCHTCDGYGCASCGGLGFMAVSV